MLTLLRRKRLLTPSDQKMHPDDRAGASGPWLAQRLSEEGLSLHPDSALARALLVLRQFRELVLSKGSTGKQSPHQLFTFFSEAFGADFLSKALHWGYDSGLRVDLDQWKQLTTANPNIATPASKSTVERNKVWETAIGSIAKTFCTEVDFIEPDIVCRFENKKIAIAAKMAYSEKQIFENVKKGLKQAGGADSNGSVDAYLIFVNVVQIYPLLDTFTQIGRSQFTRENLTEYLKNEVMSWCDRLPLEKEARRIAKKTKKPVGVGFFIPFTLVVDGNPMPFFYTHMPLTWTIESDEYIFSKKFLQACNVVLGYPHSSEPANEGKETT